VQASIGDIDQPDDPTLIGPTLHVRRYTASAIYEGRWLGRPWATTVAWGRNDKTTEHTRNRLPAWLLESTCEPIEGHAAFLRAEKVTHDESTIPLTYRKVSVGYIVDVAHTGPVRWSVGALTSYLLPSEATRFFYGDRPRAYMVFFQVRA
jgi:hypothetical protein